MSITKVQDLIAWQKSVDFAVNLYDATRTWPREEQYGLTSQLRRSGVSVSSNIAEGQGRFTTGEFLNHLSMAYGSLTEAYTQIVIGQRLSYLNEHDADALVEQANEVGKIINGLARKLELKVNQPAGRGKRGGSKRSQ